MQAKDFCKNRTSSFRVSYSHCRPKQAISEENFGRVMSVFDRTRKMLLDLEIEINGRRQRIVDSRKSTAAVGFLLNMASAEVLYHQLRKGTAYGNVDCSTVFFHSLLCVMVSSCSKNTV
jgi:hypothetical protein